MDHIELLVKSGACQAGLAFARQYSSLSEAIANCSEYSWLRWALRLIVDPKQRAAAAAHIVRYTPLDSKRFVWDLLTDERSRAAVVAAERYAAGEITAEDLRAAADAADAAAYAAYAADAAACTAAADAAYAARGWLCDYIKSLDWDNITKKV